MGSKYSSKCPEPATRGLVASTPTRGNLFESCGSHRVLISQGWASSLSPKPSILEGDPHVSYSVNSLKEDYIGNYIGDYYRGY